MKLILTESVENLGAPGDVVSVRAGFARNFLLPQGKALRATEANEAHFLARRAFYESKDSERRGAASARANAVDGSSWVMIRQAAESGHLYGSVAARDVAEMLTEAGHEVARSEVSLERNIKHTGLYPVRLRFHAGVFATVTLNIARTEADAKKQEAEAKSGKPQGAEGQETEGQETGAAEDGASPQKDAASAEGAVAESAEAEGAESPGDSAESTASGTETPASEETSSPPSEAPKEG